MSASLSLSEIVIRLALTIVAGAVLGIDRTGHGRPAGLRTTLLVCLAASIAMILANELLTSSGRPPDSFVSLDPMRLPLGILTGMGFIGAGAIVRRGKLVLGVTTAATLWLGTVIGLCMGAGQIWLGIATLGIAMGVLSGLKFLERWIPQEHRVRLAATATDRRLFERLRGQLAEAGYDVKIWDVALGKDSCKLRCELRRRSQTNEHRTPAFIEAFQEDPSVRSIRWRQ